MISDEKHHMFNIWQGQSVDWVLLSARWKVEDAPWFKVEAEAPCVCSLLLSLFRLQPCDTYVDSLHLHLKRDERQKMLCTRSEGDQRKIFLLEVGKGYTQKGYSSTLSSYIRADHAPLQEPSALAYSAKEVDLEMPQN